MRTSNNALSLSDHNDDVGEICVAGFNLFTKIMIDYFVLNLISNKLLCAMEH